MLFGVTWDLFCINLDRRTDRWEEAKREVALCGLPMPERVAAIEMENRNAGCTASHRKVWRRVATGTADAALIVEDDFMFTTRDTLLHAGYAPSSDTVRIFDTCPGETCGERLGVLWGHVPGDWDLLYLGGGYQSPPKARVSKYVIRNNGMLTTHAYAITRAFAQRLTDWLDEGYGLFTVPTLPPDTLLYQWTQERDVKSYTLTPRLFIQRPTSPSDISPRAPGGFPWSLTDPAHEMMV